MEAFADVVRSGKALYIGVSEWRAEEIRRGHELARELRIPFVSNQPQYNMLWRVIEAEVVPTCEELGIGQVVWSPIAQGVLTGKYLPGQAPPEGSRATDDQGGADMIKDLLDDDILTRVQELKPLADEAGLTMAQLAVAWTLQNPNVSAAIIGASRPEQVHDNAQASGVVLEEDLLAPRSTRCSATRSSATRRRRSRRDATAVRARTDAGRSRGQGCRLIGP